MPFSASEVESVSESWSGSWLGLLDVEPFVVLVVPLGLEGLLEGGDLIEKGDGDPVDSEEKVRRIRLESRAY